MKKVNMNNSVITGLFPAIWEEAPGQNWEKMIDLTSKLGEINDIEHNKGSKIYPQHQVILDCIMQSIVAPVSGNAPISVSAYSNGRYRSRYCKQDHAYTKQW